ncbi:MAG: hypothetical protein NTV51_22140 [Verrucomicrobia bacterium]|nr:hypothetical protein [Verrucomicrobiota bacterium]
MNAASPTVAPSSVVFKKPGVKETTVLLALAWLVPFAIHLAPWSGSKPLGAYLLPMFWATFVGAYLFGARLGVVVGLFGSVVNLLVTGLPAWKFLSVMSFELVVFAVVTGWAVRRLPRLVLIAPLGYLLAKLASTGLQLATPVFGDIGAPGDFLLSSLGRGAAGLIVLAAINAALVWFYPKTSRDGA